MFLAVESYSVSPLAILLTNQGFVNQPGQNFGAMICRMQERASIFLVGVRGPLFSSVAARGADGPPDALGRGWQFDMFDAELGERIDHRVR
jgi:hypothetical protein